MWTIAFVMYCPLGLICSDITLATDKAVEYTTEGQCYLHAIEMGISHIWQYGNPQEDLIQPKCFYKGKALGRMFIGPERDSFYE